MTRALKTVRSIFGRLRTVEEKRVVWSCTTNKPSHCVNQVLSSGQVPRFTCIICQEDNIFVLVTVIIYNKVTMRTNPEPPCWDAYWSKTCEHYGHHWYNLEAHETGHDNWFQSKRVVRWEFVLMFTQSLTHRAFFLPVHLEYTNLPSDLWWAGAMAG